MSDLRAAAASLEPELARVDGAWIGADGGRVIGLTNPADGSLAGLCPISAPTRLGGRLWRLKARCRDGVLSLVKKGGVGREGSRYGVEEFLEQKYLFDFVQSRRLNTNGSNL
jgi:hypothetical protein